MALNFPTAMPEHIERLESAKRFYHEWQQITPTRLDVMPLECLFDVPEHVFYWVEKWAISWKKYRYNAYTSQEVDDLGVSVNGRTIEDPHRM